MKRSVLFVLLIMAFSLSFSGISFSQSSGDSTTQKTLSYYKIEVGMHIMDCPVLPARLQDKLMGLKGIKDLKKDMKTESILFSIPEGVVTKEQIENIATSVGFPAGSIKVIMDSKPFPN